jgi:UDP-N-acetylmuramate: L-alanyl-gamma-D-glutamyl-meso-diaminopimelate ligase
MRIHILGISGTFMSGLALLARELGYRVTGCDTACYPPVSELLEQQGIVWEEGYEDSLSAKNADLIVVGNAIKRGMPIMEAVLNRGQAYISGPQWLAEHVLHRKQVIAVAGTHGKTTTSSMLAYILAETGYKPGFLIGGVAPNFGTNVRLGESPWFVIEADEYDSAFFDKRPKFMHYRPRIAILNNLEFDHADIYTDLSAIQQQFHYLLRTIPSEGTVIHPAHDIALQEVFSKGQYSRHLTIGLNHSANWSARLSDPDGQAFEVYRDNQCVAEVSWPLIGRFNVENALAAIAASVEIGVDVVSAAKAVEGFIPVKRRLEVKYDVDGITIYDDFAHHPTAIEKTLEALVLSQRHQRIIAVLEFASYTMRTGVHKNRMENALADADLVYILNPEAFSLDDMFSPQRQAHILPSVQMIVDAISSEARRGDAILVMSNRGFDHIHDRLSKAIRQRA